MEENENKSNNKPATFWSVKRNRIITYVVGGAVIVGIILAIALPLGLNQGQNSSSSQSSTSTTNSGSSTSSGGDGSSTSQHVELTAEQWDAAFNVVMNNFTFKCVIDNVTRNLVEFNGDGVHGVSFNASGEKYESKEEYIQWTTDKNYSYYYDTDTKLWKKEASTSEYSTKEFQTNYYKIEMTFIGRFSDFSYDADKGGYFASTAKSTEIEDNGNTEGGFEMTNVLVKFAEDKITEINFKYNNKSGDGNINPDYLVTSIGSTSFDFPIIYE